MMSKRQFRSTMLLIGIFCLSFLVAETVNTDDSSNRGRQLQERNTPLRLAVYSSAAMINDVSGALSRKQKHDFERSKKRIDGSDSGIIQIDSINYFVSNQEQKSFILKNCGDGAGTRFEELNRSKPDLAVSLLKWCVLDSALKDISLDGVMFVDSHSPIALNQQRRQSDVVSYLEDSVMTNAKDGASLPSIAVLGPENYPETIHGAFLLLRNTQENQKLAKWMLDFLLSSDENTMDTLDANALLYSQTLYAHVQRQVKSGQEWYFLEQHCRMQPPRRLQDASEVSISLQDGHPLLKCPESAGYCCTIQDRHSAPIGVMISRFPMLPYQTIQKSNVRIPYNHDSITRKAEETSVVVVGEDELPYISTVTETLIPKPDDFGPTPTYFDLLMGKKCLPDDDSCSKCLREKTGANCESCGRVCSCFCKALCNPAERPPKRHVAKKMVVTPPAYRRDPSRLVPRIVHQTWFEELEPDKYPNMSRLVQSFARSGWEYKFYTDDQARDFLFTHFPKEVLEAYDTLGPGAFKADLFRYCVLLIHGGVYADVDIQLEAALDLAIAPDVGFMVPVDEPGKPVNHQMCVWNGFIASAPGHPFLAKAIETIVNQVRNRFTSVDVDETFCDYDNNKGKVKSPELSVLHAYDTLFTAGPCLLGSSINRVLGRPGQTSFHPGELKGIWDKDQRKKTTKGTSFVIGIPNDKDAQHYDQARIPGRTIILHQNKWDMGAHRFTFLEQNLVVAATDLPDSNDLEAASEKNKGDKTPAKEHYSKTHAKTGVYGFHHVYTTQDIAYEDIEIFVDVSRHTKAFVQPLVSDL